jgi:TPR repeat protein
MDLDTIVTSIDFCNYDDSLEKLHNNLEEMHEICRKNCVNNHVAMCNLGFMYERGLGTDISLENAFYWYKSSAELGNAIAMYCMCTLYGLNNYLKPDSVKSFEWAYKSATMHNVVAMYTLGYMYYNGEGTRLDKDTGLEWFNKAASRGSTISMTAIGFHYFYVKSYDEGSKWFIQSIDAGDMTTFKKMADYYLKTRTPKIIDIIMPYYNKIREANEAIKMIFEKNTDIFVSTWQKNT